MVVRRGREDRYALIARLGFGDGATHCPHLFLSCSLMPSGPDKVCGRTLQDCQIWAQLAVDGVHFDHHVRCLIGRHMRRAAERGKDAHNPGKAAKLCPDLLLSRLVEHRDGVSTVDENQPRT